MFGIYLLYSCYCHCYYYYFPLLSAEKQLPDLLDSQKHTDSTPPQLTQGHQDGTFSHR